MDFIELVPRAGLCGTGMEKTAKRSAYSALGSWLVPSVGGIESTRVANPGPNPSRSAKTLQFLQDDHQRSAFRRRMGQQPGKGFKFDDVHCLLAYRRNSPDSADKGSLYFVDFSATTACPQKQSLFYQRSASFPDGRQHRCLRCGGFAQTAGPAVSGKQSAGLNSTFHEKLLLILGWWLLAAFPGDPHGREGRPIPLLSASLESARDGDTILVQAGIYREQNLVIHKRVCLRGLNWPTLDGEKKYEIVRITVPGVTIEGFRVVHSGYSGIDDLAGIRVTIPATSRFGIISSTIISSASTSPMARTVPSKATTSAPMARPNCKVAMVSTAGKATACWLLPTP